MLTSMLFASEPARPGPTDDFWYNPLRATPAAGFVPTTHQVLQLTPVAACLRAIAETIASLPVHVYRERGDGTKEWDRDHWLNDLLRLNPNALMCGSEWIDFMTRTAALRGNAYSRKITSPGMVHRLIPLPFEAVTPRVDGFTISYEVKTQTGVETLGPDQVMHLRAGDLMRTGLLAEDPIESYGEVFAAALAAQNYAARYFANDATPRGIVELDGGFKDEEKQNQFMQRLKRALSGRNQHSNLLLTGGAKYKQVGSTNKESQLLELRGFYVVEICRIFGVPPHVAKDLGDATYSNIEQQALEFVKTTIMPWVVRWEQLIRKTLITEPDVFVKFNLDALIRGDITSRYAAFASAINTGWMTRNEARELEDMNAIDGLDEPVMQGAMTSTPQEPAPNKPPPKRKTRQIVDEEARALRESWAARKPGAFKAWTREFYETMADTLAEHYSQAVVNQYTRQAYARLNRSDAIAAELDTWEELQLAVLENLVEKHA